MIYGYVVFSELVLHCHFYDRIDIKPRKAFSTVQITPNSTRARSTLALEMVQRRRTAKSTAAAVSRRSATIEAREMAAVVAPALFDLYSVSDLSKMVSNGTLSSYRG